LLQYPGAEQPSSAFAVRLFVDCQRTLIEWFGVGVSSQTHHRRRDIGVIGAKRLFPDRQRALSEWYRIRVPSNIINSTSPQHGMTMSALSPPITPTHR
jgi:hypothetical protein